MDTDEGDGWDTAGGEDPAEGAGKRFAEAATRLARLTDEERAAALASMTDEEVEAFVQELNVLTATARYKLLEEARRRVGGPGLPLGSPNRRVAGAASGQPGWTQVLS
jgi:hypothetical protein